MQSIIGELYFATVEYLDNTHAKNKALDEEDNVYEKLCSTIDDYQKKLLEGYIELLSQRNCKREKELFSIGFKKGVLLTREVFTQT